MSKPNMSMKLLVDKRKHKVMFAEAGNECVDFLFHILSLPLGSVVGFLTKESMAGSIGTLYGSLGTLVNPQLAIGSSYDVPLLTIKPAAANHPFKFYYCCSNVNHRSYVSIAAGAVCPRCKERMNTSMSYVAPPALEAEKQGENSAGGGYVKGVITYMIMDDLSVQPMSTISNIALLNKLGIKDMSRFEEKEVTLDINMVVALLKASIMSNTALTDVFLPKKPRFISRNLSFNLFGRFGIGLLLVALLLLADTSPPKKVS